RAHYLQISDSRARDRRAERDLHLTLGAGSERLSAVILLGEIDSRSKNLIQRDRRFSWVADHYRVCWSIAVNRALAEVDVSGRNLKDCRAGLRNSVRTEERKRYPNSHHQYVTEIQRSFLASCLSPKMAVPTRTEVAPSSMAISKS